ncbi:WcaI family glycosyltransferase [Mucilaginibacter aquariorum]|uniref:WcaI family glycosyltransferase n=1 Tax=Mucilaginibacter aquariorum TaxID=2967225 RepID=A0ABT1SXM8_9SPHI|nr:WcaI family glycosyltransferase [Mucilaginibacter aquariorum]MCQ6956483.1 WcaI family glycosyltransferase [Mucilaginibacter aquariorum]
MQNRILLIGGNFYPEPIGIGKYNGEMMDWLATNGYDCTVVTTYPYYPQWKVQTPYVNKAFWYKKEIKYIKPFYESSVKIYRCPQFVPVNPTGAKRMILDFSFFITSFLLIIKLLLSVRKYDIVISVVPAFQLGLLGILYKKLRGGRFFYHIQDLQIDAARDLGMIKSKTLIDFLLGIEKYILKHADVVSSISAGMIEKIKMKCGKQIDFFPNWVDTKMFYPISEKALLKQEFNFDPEDTIVLYSGAVGEKQGLENILLTAKSFIHKTHVKFVICGSGPYLKKLEDMKAKFNLNNVVFMSTQPIEKLNRFLNMADVHLVLQKNNATDLIMPSKLTTILAIGGVALVTAVQGSSLYNLIKLHNLGIIAEPENLTALSTVINTAIENSNEEIQFNARTYAEKYLSIEKIISRFSYNMKESPEVHFMENFNFQASNQFTPVES